MVSFCPHQRRRSTCKECGGGEPLTAPAPEDMPGVRGAGICQHQRIRSRCKECGGAGFCPHQRRRDRCKECRTEVHALVPDRRVPNSERQEDGGAAQNAVIPKVEEVDGSYACLICGESVRGKDARRCSACTCPPRHTECAPATVHSVPSVCWELCGAVEEQGKNKSREERRSCTGTVFKDLRERSR